MKRFISWAALAVMLCLNVFAQTQPLPGDRELNDVVCTFKHPHPGNVSFSPESSCNHAGWMHVVFPEGGYTQKPRIVETVVEADERGAFTHKFERPICNCNAVGWNQCLDFAPSPDWFRIFLRLEVTRESSGQFEYRLHAREVEMKRFGRQELRKDENSLSAASILKEKDWPKIIRVRTGEFSYEVSCFLKE